MKPSRILTACAAIALFCVVAVGAAPANAAPGDVYVAAADLAPTASPPQTGWSYAATTPAPVSTAAGLAVPQSAGLTLSLGTTAAGVDLVPFGIAVITDPAADAAGVRFSIGLLTAPDVPANYEVITADEPGVGPLGDSGATWSGTFFPGSLTLPEIDALLDAGSPGHLIATISFGGAGAPFTTARFAANGVTYVFTPVPTASVTPAAPTPLAFGTTGVTATFTGLLPGAQVFAFFIPASGEPEDAVLIDQELTADAAGSVTLGYIAATTTTPPGAYSIVVGDGLDVFEAAFTVVAAVDPAAPVPPGGSSPAAAAAAAAPVLAATGADSGPGLFVGATLLLFGTPLLLAAHRVRRAGRG